MTPISIQALVLSLRLGGTSLALDILRIVVGLLILVVAADRLVLSAVRIAKILNVSVIIIGAMIVGFGTSVPEFVVSALAASDGQTGLAMSNVVASNTANLTIVLGASALIAVLATQQSVIKREGLLMLASVGLLAAILIDGQVSTTEGAILVAGMAVAIGLLILWAKNGTGQSSDDMSDIVADPARIWHEVTFGVVALVATVIAGQLLLDGVVAVGDAMGLSVVFMGLITGVGTSFPELSAAIAGARRGASDLVLGNVLGSNIFNSLGVAGLAAIIGPGEFGGAPPLLLAVMIAAAVFAGLFAFTSQRITRAEGVGLIGVFVVYALLAI